jgi:hypothetical protein
MARGGVGKWKALQIYLAPSSEASLPHGLPAWTTQGESTVEFPRGWFPSSLPPVPEYFMTHQLQQVTSLIPSPTSVLGQRKWNSKTLKQPANVPQLIRDRVDQLQSLGTRLFPASSLSSDFLWNFLETENIKFGVFCITFLLTFHTTQFIFPWLLITLSNSNMSF